MNLIEHIKAGGEVQTRDGRKVRVLATDVKGGYPIVAVVEGPGEHDHVICCHKTGVELLVREGPVDLVPVPRKFRFERWVNVFRSADGTACLGGYYLDQESAKCRERIACVKVIIEGTEGDGL